MAIPVMKRRPVIFRLVMKSGDVWEVTKPWLHPPGEHPGEKIDTMVTGIFRFEEVPRREKEDENGDLVEFEAGRSEHYLVFGLPLKPIECAPDDPEALRIKTEEGGQKLVYPKPEHASFPVYVDQKGQSRKFGPFGKANEGSIAEISPDDVERVEFTQAAGILKLENDRLVNEDMGAEAPEPAKQKTAAAGSEPKPQATSLPTFG